MPDTDTGATDTQHVRLADLPAIAKDWGIEPPFFQALYVSSGCDTKAITFLHPEFLAEQFGRPVEAPSVFVYVDKAAPPDEPLAYSDEKTAITTIVNAHATLCEFPAALQRIRFSSTEKAERDVLVARLQAENEAFTQAALSESWKPHIFIGVNDGCGAFGQNDRCENRMDAATSVPLRLNAVWWVTDHLPNSNAGHDPQDGDEIRALDPEFAATLKQVAFLSTKWRSRCREDLRLRGGARIFDIQPSHKLSPAEFARRSIIYSPYSNRALR